jgi:hypothetical protein
MSTPLKLACPENRMPRNVACKQEARARRQSIRESRLLCGHNCKGEIQFYVGSQCTVYVQAWNKAKVHPLQRIFPYHFEIFDSQVAPIIQTC